MEKRELKFRVWNGMEMVYDVTVGKFGVFYVNPGDKGNGLDPKDSASLTPFNTKYHEDTPVMQYTGLKDKNGKEIYEGDIVELENKYTYEVVYQDAKFILVHVRGNALRGTVWGDLKRMLDPDFSQYDFGVTGNIYQNLELLKR